MGFLNFKKPKWHHKNPAVRLESIDSIDPGETEVLAGLSLEDQDQLVRRAAISRLTDPTILEQLAADADPEDLSFIIASKDQLLYDLVVKAPTIDECRNDLARITSPELLAQLAVNGEHPEIRLAAVIRIDDQLLLAGIVEEKCGKEPARAAMAKITAEELLGRLAKSAASKTARRLAAAKLSEIEQQRNQPDRDEILAQTLHGLAAEAAQLAAGADIDEAAGKLAVIKAEWQKLDSSGQHPAHSAFTQTCNDFTERLQEIQQRRQEEQEKAARYGQQQTGLAEICSTIERLTDSTAKDAESAKEQAVVDWNSLLHDPEVKSAASAALSTRFAQACQAFDSRRNKIRQEGKLVEIIERECAEMKELLVASNLSKAAAQLAATEKKLAGIKFKYFSKKGSHKLVSALAADLSQAQKEAGEQNLARHQEICTELEELALAENINRAERQLQTIKQTWRQLPTVDGAAGSDLEKRFQQAVTNLTEKLESFQHEQDWQLWANLSLKEILAARVEALDQQEDLEAVVTVIKESQAEWKSIGAVPQKKAQKLWDKFHSSCDRNFQRAEPYLAELKTRRAEAVVRRREICVLAAELAESSEWQKTTNALKGLQEEWKNLLHGSRREEKELYQTFRSACDSFFERRQENYQIKDQERQQHLLDKEKLCEEAEELAAKPQADYAKKIRDLQAAWKKTGPAPRAQQDAIWQRFRTACDTYFNWVGEGQQQNLTRKEELCAMAEKLLAVSEAGGKQKELAAKLAEIQQQWKEIGPVPREQSEAVWQRFREPCDAFFAARHLQFEKEEEQRRQHQVRKEELLAQAEELACQGTDKKTAEQLQKLQKEWYGAGAAPREVNKILNDRFKDLCDAFFSGRRQYFADLKDQHRENQKKKESLCLRLENILGVSHESAPGGRGKALSLAEELKQAMEDNFMLAGRRNEKKSIHEEIKRLEQDWQKIGSVPPKQLRLLTARFKKALDGYYQSRRNEKPGESGAGK